MFGKKPKEKTQDTESFSEREMKKKLNERKLTKVITSLLFILVGVVLIIWRDPALTVICTIIGALLCAAGVVGIVMYFVTKERGIAGTAILVIGVVAAVVGFYLALNPEVLMTIVPAVVGILILISGILNLSETITIKKEKGESALLSLILSLITIALGILIILKPSALNSVILVLMGFSLIYDGVSNLIIIAGITGMVHEIKQERKEAAADATVVDAGYTEVKPAKPNEAAAEKTPAAETPKADASSQDTSAEESKKES